MEKQQFSNACAEMTAFHIPRWNELPEFDLYMDQVIALAEKYLRVLSVDSKPLLTPSMINNYVKSGVLPPPVNKKYNRKHLAIVMIICITKPVMEISAISEIIQKGLSVNSLEFVLDSLAKTFENEISSVADHAKTAVEQAENTDVIGFVAIDHMMKANAARTIAMHAYHSIKIQESADQPKTEKTDKKNEKKKAKKEAEASEQTDL